MSDVPKGMHVEGQPKGGLPHARPFVKHGTSFIGVNMRAIGVNMRAMGVHMHIIGVHMHIIGVPTKFVSDMPKCVHVEGQPYAPWCVVAMYTL